MCVVGVEVELGWTWRWRKERGDPEEARQGGEGAGVQGCRGAPEGATFGNDPADQDAHPFYYVNLKDGRSLYFVSVDLDFDYLEE